MGLALLNDDISYFKLNNSHVHVKIHIANDINILDYTIVSQAFFNIFYIDNKIKILLIQHQNQKMFIMKNAKIIDQYKILVRFQKNSKKYY